MPRIKTVIMGAAGRDFHNFNIVFRNDRRHEVIAFTATQIPNIEGRLYPPSLAGKLYPRGIPILPEADLDDLIRRERVEEVVFSYSDVSCQHVMSVGALVTAAGSHFRLLSPRRTWLKSRVPVVSVCAVRTGAGKSQTSRRVARILRQAGLHVVVVRHPMPYGDLRKQRVQRFASIADLDKHQCTVEEREDFEPHIEMGSVLYAGIDYRIILGQAEREAQVILWDGGNNDLPFFEPDLHIVVADPLRLGHELTYHPSEANLRLAHVVIMNKIDVAEAASVEALRKNIQSVNPRVTIVEAASPISVDHPERIRGQRVLVIEDGPTLTHGEMRFGAGTVAARRYGAREIVDPRPYAVGAMRSAYERYPDVGALLPAMGYGKRQVRDLEATIRHVPCDVVVLAAPMDLQRILRITYPTVRVRYELEEIGRPDLGDVLSPFMERCRARP